MINTWWFQNNASGLFAAGWAEIWHWGLGIGLLILCGLLAYFSPFDKKYFIGAAVVIAVAMFVYGIGHHDAAVVCEAKVKKIYLQAHPKITPKNIAPQWKVSPSWNPAAPPNYKPTTCDGPFDTNCWGQY